MARFLLRRFALALVTLFVLSVLVFAASQLLPGDIGRNVLGPFASPNDVKLLDHELGVDRPVYVQYIDWVWKFIRGNLGTSLQYQVPVASLLGPSLVNSLKLAAVAFALVVPLSIVGGVFAALRRGRLADRVITLTGLSLTAVPEFISAIVLILIFGVLLKWLPVSAAFPVDADFLDQVDHLLLPAMALVFVLFGYIARMARTGTIDALESDYTRTAYLKGLPTPTVIRRHVLRNSLLPTIAVIATQMGYLIGGLVVIEKLFNYNGIGQRIYTAAQNKDFTMLQSGVLVVGLVYLTATLIADILYSLLNPRIRYAGVE
ncbi:MAG TPA: ABC transporter permease [Candidatus Dormibacteraeota bacterium]|nr:ABC transporter permease [Candidatus Dormibacteraeota bacterium]